MNSKTTDMAKARQVINETDKEISRLFEKRMEAVKKISGYKRENGLPVEDKVREEQLLKALSENVLNEEIRSYYINLQKTLMSLSKDYQHRLLDGMRVAFSGVKGAFANIAVERIFPDCTPVPFCDFKSAYKSCENGECDCVVLPIENSFEGDVAQVMDLAYFGSLFINGIYDLPVEQHLFGVDGATIDTIKTVKSHPQALGQCAEYIRAHKFIPLEAVNTAVAAKETAKNNDISAGVICSNEAGEEYGLKLLERKINEDSGNTTRFAVFSRVQREASVGNESFIMLFTVKDEAGSL